MVLEDATNDVGARVSSRFPDRIVRIASRSYSDGTGNPAVRYTVTLLDRPLAYAWSELQPIQDQLISEHQLCDPDRIAYVSFFTESEWAELQEETGDEDGYEPGSHTTRSGHRSGDPV